MVSEKKKSAIRRQFSSLQNALFQNDKSKNSKNTNYFNHSNSFLWIVSGLILSACAPGRQQRLPDDITPDPADIPLLNQITLTSVETGSAGNGQSFGLSAGTLSVTSYSLGNRDFIAVTYTAQSTVQQVVDLINTDPTSSAVFTATINDGVSGSDAFTDTASFSSLDGGVDSVLTISEGVTPDDILIQATAFDQEDALSNTDLTHSLTDASGKFEIDAATGAVSLRDGESLDFEAATNSFDLTITATDSGGNSSSLSFTLQVADVNEAIGTASADTLGTNANDIIFGAGGADVIDTAGGDDVVIYRYSSSAPFAGTDGDDVINNFEVGRDKIQLIDTDAANPAEAIATLVASSADDFLMTLIHDAGADTVAGNADDNFTSATLKFGTNTVTVNFASAVNAALVGDGTHTGNYVIDNSELVAHFDAFENLFGDDILEFITTNNVSFEIA